MGSMRHFSSIRFPQWFTAKISTIACAGSALWAMKSLSTPIFAALSSSGYSPKGFTAGSWFVSETVLDVLVELGFVYDCSAQIPKPRNPTPDPRMQWLRLPQNYRNGRGKLLLLPTTCSLGEWFKWGWKTARDQTHWHQIVYLHDYDLLSFHRHLMLLCFLRITHSETFEPTSMAVQQYLVHGGLAQCP